MEMEQSVSDSSYRISKSWMINCVMLLSMMVQLLLTFGGALRYRSGSSVLQLVVWLGYMSADAMAIYVLGVMVHFQSRAIFGIWAPILLSHLGGPDTISAYSTPDNELWLRHLFTMLYQISVAVYVVYLSQLGGYLLAAAVLLLVVGISKYAERIMALRYSSLSQIVSSADPMNVFMQLEGERCDYLVMGLKQWRKSRNVKVTITDVWNSEGKELTENYMLCLSYALFKMNKRRYVNLYLHERYYNRTRDFLFAEELSHIPSPQKIFTVAEMELKFLYDLLFSKSSGTAFSKLGMVMRLVNICLIGITGFLIYRELASQRVVEETLYTQRMVAYALLSVAIVLEIVQFCRILTSDWSMVWLICARIQYIDNSCGRIGLDLYMAMLIQIVIQISSRFRKYCRGKYWKDQIAQYSIIDSCSHISPSIWKLTKFLHLTSFVTSWYNHTEPVEDDLKIFLVEQLKQRCSTEEDVENCRTQLMSYDFGLEVNQCEDLKWASQQDQEHLILHWHIATTICEMQREAKPSSNMQDQEIKRNIDISRTLSRYCAYLLVSTSKLLPLHPDIESVKHMDVHNELIRLADLGYNRMNTYERYSTLGHGAKLARELQQKPEQLRWKIISDYWGGVMIFYALKNKASVHAERLTVGGEFLTLLWAIVGHMGVGDQ
ncbi:hypothetical protein SUGI_0941560 [Cryptomeria japonica]|uniref:uncharacterized protein LOC131058051 n=1 Tax=Cryptomeria japonica TaxID=3369 RepID=UPI002414A733|nr:uncharacterized protein LOC131058051 [Cryptomeria japonica]GLJ44767.1 hypothetical protein SUGI_0941560 [Cryptomeria japonica]